MPGLNQVYEIANVNSGKALEVSGGSEADGASVVQNTYHNNTDQQWYFKLSGTINNQEVYQIVNSNSGKVLDVSGGSKADGATVQQWEPTGNSNQLWYLKPVDLINWLQSYEIISVASDKALTVVGSSVEDNATIQQWTTTDGANQQWFFNPVTSVDLHPQIAVETKYMQNYRASSPVNGSNEVTSICDRNGQVELFTIGTDGNITVFTPDTSSETGYSAVKLTTNLKATSLAAGLDSQGQVVLFALVDPGPSLYYLVKTTSSTSLTTSWTAPQKLLSLEVPSGVSAVDRIIAKNIAGNLYVALLWTTGTNQYTMTYSIWETVSPTFILPTTPPLFSSPHCLWLGNTAEEVVFANFSQSIVYLYNLATKQLSYGGTGSNLEIVSVDTVVDASGNNQIFAILSDKNAYLLSEASTTDRNEAYTWGQCSEGISFQEIATEVNSQGQAQIFAVSAPMSVSPGTDLVNVLYHWNMHDAPNPSPIAQSTGMYLQTVSDEQGDIDLFTIDSKDHVAHLFQEEASENWTEEIVEVQNGPIEEFCSYSTDIKVSDASGALAIGSPVTIWASDEARITVNGATFFIDPYHAGQTATNSAGMLSITQEATSLAIPSLQINLSEFMQPGESLVIQQYADVQSRLATVTSDDLLSATVEDGSYLLPDQYRTSDYTIGIAQSLNQCMVMVGEPTLSATTSPYLRKKGPKRGVWLRPSGSAADLRKLAHSRPKQCWQLSIEGNAARYRDLTQHEAQALIASEKATAQLGGAFDWIDDIGDFFEGVANDIIDVTNVIVTTLEEGVQAVISFVIDNVPYVFDTIITIIDEAFDLAELIFAAFLVPYKMLFQWLADLFGWDDILRSKDALVYTVNQLLGFFQKAAPGLQAFLDSNIGQLQSQLTDIFNNGIENIAGQSTIGGYEQSNAVVNAIFEYAFSNNFLFNKLIEYLASALASFKLSDDSGLDQLSQQLMDLVTRLEKTVAYADASSFFQILGSDPDQIFTQLLATLFRITEELLQEGLTGIQSILDLVLQEASTFVANMQSMLNAPWNIPFISEFYSLIAPGSQLTTLDLLCLIVAIPINLYYEKAGLGDAPFTNDASLQTFKNAFNAQMMVQTSGLASVGLLQSDSGDGDDPDKPAIELEPWEQQFVVFGYSCATALCGLLSAMDDRISPYDPYGEASMLLKIANYTSAAIAFACRYEGFFTAGDLNILRAAGVSNTTYYVGATISVVVALLAIKWYFRPPLNAVQANDVFSVLLTLGGSINLVLSIVMVAMSDESDLKKSWRVLQPIPWVAQFLRISAIQSPATLRALAGIDMLFYFSVAELGFWALS